MECQDIKNLLSDYIDGELSGDEATRVAGHLEACADCTETYEEMMRLVGFMREMDTVDEPADFAQSVRARMEGPPSTWARVRRLLSPPAVHLPLGAAVAAAVLLMVIYVPDRPEVGAPPSLTVDKKSAEGADAPATIEVTSEDSFERSAEPEKMKGNLPKSPTEGRSEARTDDLAGMPAAAPADVGDAAVSEVAGREQPAQEKNELGAGKRQKKGPDEGTVVLKDVTVEDAVPETSVALDAVSAPESMPSAAQEIAPKPARVSVPALVAAVGGAVVARIYDEDDARLRAGEGVAMRKMTESTDEAKKATVSRSAPVKEDDLDAVAGADAEAEEEVREPLAFIVEIPSDQYVAFLETIAGHDMTVVEIPSETPTDRKTLLVRPAKP